MKTSMHNEIIYTNRDLLFVILCFFSICTTVQADSLDVNYFASRNIYRFADYLYNEGDYLRAAGEFQRYLFAFDSLPPHADSIFYKIGRCYGLGGNLLNAIDYFSRIIDRYPQSYLLDQSRYHIALSYSLMGRFEESTSLLYSDFPSIKQNDVKQKMEQLIALNYIQQKKWNTAINFLDTLKTNNSQNILIKNFAEAGEQLPRKNKFLSGLFSTVIPGAGKVYSGRSWDGIFSFITIGLTGWQAYEGFREDGTHSIKGWILGSISSIFYLGNIYGSVVAAQIYNEQQEENLLNKLKLSINVNF